MIHTDTMELIIKNQQEQIKGLLETNRTLVESNQKLMEQTGELQQKKYRNYLSLPKEGESGVIIAPLPLPYIQMSGRTFLASRNTSAEI